MPNDWDNMPQAYKNHLANCRRLGRGLRPIEYDVVARRNLAKMRRYRRGVTRCEVCRSSKPEHTHHITRVADGGVEDEDNYLAVCVDCHDELHPELPQGWIKSRTATTVVKKRSNCNGGDLLYLLRLAWARGAII